MSRCDVTSQNECSCSCSYRVLSVEVTDGAPAEEEEEEEEEEGGVRRVDVDWDSLPWFGSEPAGERRSLAPLTAL